MRTTFAIVSFFLAVAAPVTVSAHGVVTEVQGANGVTGTGFGVDPSTPRDCTRRNPCQQDSSILAAGGCGRTLQKGQLNIQTEMAAQYELGGGQLPSVGANGQLTLTYHQVNADGAGPLSADVDPTGQGQTFQPATVVQNIPGRRGRDRNGQTTDFPVTVQVPAGLQCTGGPNGDACIMRVKNANRNNFGGCIAFTMEGAAAKTAEAPAAEGAAAEAPAAKAAPKAAAKAPKAAKAAKAAKAKRAAKAK
ncbi:hypothetical protein HDU96_000078 [Phlyctochytrium bullatum]|nr:hypothetical protein HDU96_000078 [Phlyctochytrium bullatum]